MRYQEKAREILQRASRYYEAHGVPFPVDDSMEFTLGQRQHSLVGREYILVKTPIAVIWLMKPTGELYMFMNRELVSGRPNPDVVTQKWTGEEVEMMARQFIIALMGSMPENLEAKPTMRYSPGEYEISLKWGEWTVWWNRVDKHGRTFLNDGVRVRLIDGVGAEGFAVNMWSKYEERDFEPIPKEKALKLAKKHTLKTRIFHKVMAWLKGFFSSSEEVTAELYIVNSNVTPREEWPPFMEGMKLTSNARLAWVAKYTWSYTNRKGEEESVGVQVWIDAENGKFLGGIF